MARSRTGSSPSTSWSTCTRRRPRRGTTPPPARRRLSEGSDGADASPGGAAAADDLPGAGGLRGAGLRGAGLRGAGLRVAGALVAAGLLVAAGPLSGAGRAQEAASPSGLGRAPTAAELADRIVGPDGADLPEGSGNAAEGAMVFARRGCSTCHGPTGEEGPSISLVGGDVTTRTNYWPIRHWPFAPGIWDYVRRVMPYDRPGILTDDETYAVTAYLLYRNDIISEEAVMNAETLPEVRMPRRDDYVMPGTWTPETRRGFRIESDR